MRVAFFGTPSWAVPVLDALNRHHQVVLVVTQPDKPKGRGLKPAPSPVAQYALEHGLPLLKPERLKGNEEFLETFRAASPEVAVTAAYGKILPKEVLEVPPYGFLNLHPSLLPKYRGPAPVPWVLIRGEKETGVAIMKTEEGLDTGPLYALWRTEILPEEDAVGPLRAPPGQGHRASPKGPAGPAPPHAHAPGGRGQLRPPPQKGGGEDSLWGKRRGHL
jgi:methionyl-tRNA formyltransferase